MQNKTPDEHADEIKKFDFGPRVNWSRPNVIQSIHKVNLNSEICKENNTPTFQLQANHFPKLDSPSVDVTKICLQVPQPAAVVVPNVAVLGSCSNSVHVESVARVAELEKENEDLRKAFGGATEESLGDLLVEMELESLREEVSRLEALVNNGGELASLRLRCTDLEATVGTLKKEKAALEQKNSTSRNADLSRIRELQEQVTHERKMRERIVNNESALPVVNIGERSATPTRAPTPSGTTIRPRANIPVSASVPAFVAVAAKVPSYLDKTMILPPMTPGDIGEDYIASQWKLCLSDKPPSWRLLLSRTPGSNIFSFGGLKVACKKIGNHTMIQLGRETMLLEKFVETHGPKNATVDSTPTAASTPIASVTMKKILGAKKNMVPPTL